MIQRARTRQVLLLGNFRSFWSVKFKSKSFGERFFFFRRGLGRQIPLLNTFGCCCASCDGLSHGSFFATPRAVKPEDKSQQEHGEMEK